MDGQQQSSSAFQEDRDRQEYRWPFWPVVPLYPYGQRRTLRQEVVKDTVWTFDQIQGIFYVVVPIRMTVIKLKPSGLLVYSPVAPTPECIRLMRELEAAHGPVRYILMTTTTGIEHKVFVGPFARRFPKAQVFVAPFQWSYPLNLPLSWLGLPGDRTQRLPENPNEAPFADQFDYSILGPIRLGLGPFVEVALFHRDTRTLCLTDALIAVPQEPPAALQLDPYPLLFHSRDRATDPFIDTPEQRRLGWQRIALFAVYFRPSGLDVPSLKETIQAALKASDRRRRAYFGLFPFRWKPGWQQSFKVLHGGGRPLVAPVLRTLIFTRGPKAVKQWVEQVAQWQFERVIPCHLEAPLTMGPETFRQVFAVLTEPTAERSPLLAEDLALLEELDAGLVKRRITPPRSLDQ